MPHCLCWRHSRVPRAIRSRRGRDPAGTVPQRRRQGAGRRRGRFRSAPCEGAVCVGRTDTPEARPSGDTAGGVAACLPLGRSDRHEHRRSPQRGAVVFVVAFNRRATLRVRVGWTSCRGRCPLRGYPGDTTVSKAVHGVLGSTLRVPGTPRNGGRSGRGVANSNDDVEPRYPPPACSCAYRRAACRSVDRGAGACSGPGGTGSRGTGTLAHGDGRRGVPRLPPPARRPATRARRLHRVDA